MRTVLLLLFASAIGVWSDNFSKEGQLNLLNVHNEFRSQLALGQLSFRGVKKPSASMMRKISWSKKLTNAATKFAETCPKNHSVVMNTGESIFWHFSSSLSTPEQYATLAPQKWWNEFETNGWDSLIYNHASQRFQIGHAVQMAWHTTSKVGCGYSKCAVGTPEQTMVVVCRYFQKGNIEGEPIYNEGETCTKCPEEYQKCPSGLCEKEGVETD
ncbi:SCP domain-containing protein [Caenorhabditis elegans]|uniref:SCP domain-containing protein n=1 Tax=Caenorhabditis elegans TaxID=6239 RepID=Q93747_CAEEL|nr:SCP domain-containing protein [Caenorhabditis elegans]CAA94351.1 SCP domain-containing protein [Caenorhabditis elegans]|eukprot:NP_502497.1 SCP-Like extracellular protein [Caenorhabditis elegans]